MMKFIPFMVLLCFCAAGLTQEYTTTEELQVEKLYIEATSKRILGSYEDAAKLYEQVLEMDPASDAAAYELSRVYDAMGERTKALETIEKAIRLNASNSWYYVMKADILEKQENYTSAAETYAYLIEQFPDQRYYFEHLVDLYKRTGQIRKALATLVKYEEHMGVTESVIREQFDLYNQVGEPEKAMSAVERLIRTYPNDMDYLHLAATYCIQLGQEDKARRFYERILRENPDDARARLAMAREFRETGQDVDYLKSIYEIIGNPSIHLDAKIQELIPFTERLAAHPDDALNVALLELTDQLLDAHPNEAKVYALRADLFLLAGNLEYARKAYERTVQLDNSVYTVWEQLLYILAEQRDLDALIRTSEKALDVFPNQATIYYLAGLGHFEKRNYSEAVSMLEQALIMTSQQPALRTKILSLLGNVYFGSGQPEKAVQAFDKALGLAPESFLVLSEYSFALAKAEKDLKKAYTMAEKAAMIQPGSGSVQHILALIAFEQKNYKIARQHAENALASGYDKNSEHLELYGDILFSLGETDAAVEAWQAGMSMDADNTRLQRKIEERKIVH